MGAVIGRQRFRDLVQPLVELLGRAARSRPGSCRRSPPCTGRSPVRVGDDEQRRADHRQAQVRQDRGQGHRLLWDPVAQRGRRSGAADGPSIVGQPSRHRILSISITRRVLISSVGTVSRAARIDRVIDHPVLAARVGDDRIVTRRDPIAARREDHRIWGELFERSGQRRVIARPSPRNAHFCRSNYSLSRTDNNSRRAGSPSCPRPAPGSARGRSSPPATAPSARCPAANDRKSGPSSCTFNGPKPEPQ